MSVNNIDSQKNELREKYKRLRKSFSKALKSELDSKIREKLLSLDIYRNTRALLAFVSTDIEVDTWKIISNTLELNKKTAVPLCDTKATAMRFYFIESFDDLKKGCFGILEPDAEKCVPAGVNDAELMIVPGLAFDKNGYRIGFGKGYYDRFLSKYKGTKIGVCYSSCIENELPCDKYDKKVDLIVTDKFIIDTR